MVNSRMKFFRLNWNGRKYFVDICVFMLPDKNQAILIADDRD